MINKNLILIVGSLIVVCFAYKWYYIEQKNGNLSFEPAVTLAGAVLTALGYFFTTHSSSKVNKKANSSTIQQNHSGTGDNIAGNKTVIKK